MSIYHIRKMDFSEPLKYASREGLAADGYGEMFKVPSVLLVTAMVDSRTSQKQQERPQQKKQTAFADVLRETQKEMQQPTGISYQASGYTKDAIGYCYTVMKREYL